MTTGPRRSSRCAVAALRFGAGVRAEAQTPQAAAARSTSRSAPSRRTTIATRSDTCVRSIPWRRTIRRCCSSTRRSIPRSRATSRESWTVAPDGLTYTFKLHRRQVPRRLGVDLGRHQGDLRPPPQPAAGRGVDPQGDLRRHRRDRDARPADGRLQAEGAERLDARELRLALGLHLQRAKLQQDPKFPEKNILGTGPFTFVEHVAGSHWSASATTTISEGPALSRRLPGVFMRGAAMINALQGGQVLAEFRGHVAGRARPAACRRWATRSASRNRRWMLQLARRLQHREEAVRRRARAPRAVAGDRPLGRRTGLSRSSSCARSAA